LIDAEYTRHPFYGSRKRVVYLEQAGHRANRKRARRLTGILGLAGMAPGPPARRPPPQHKACPYLLRGMAAGRPNQVWSADIAYVRLARGMAIRMDGRGRALDNIFVERLWRSVKYEDVYLKGYAGGPEQLLGLADYFAFYNAERFHQSLDCLTPDEVYRTATGGGARIVDKYAEKEISRTETEAESGQRCSAASDGLPS